MGGQDFNYKLAGLSETCIGSYDGKGVNMHHTSYTRLTSNHVSSLARLCVGVQLFNRLFFSGNSCVRGWGGGGGFWCQARGLGQNLVHMLFGFTYNVPS